ncbi:MAG TPA: hypothetical protein DEU95_14365, partial [Chloroflexi bacterium]|nr:hypothetical protein [Chloroflexota bacterium]
MVGSATPCADQPTRDRVRRGTRPFPRRPRSWRGSRSCPAQPGRAGDRGYPCVCQRHQHGWSAAGRPATGCLPRSRAGGLVSGSEPASLRLRPEQRAVVECYRGGYAAIAAVPGAGKTTTLSALAAELIARGDNLGRDRHVMIVTYQNSGVSNFQRAVAARLRERGLPERGIAVRTLHGLANDVLAATRHRVRLDADLIVIDERDAHRLVESVVEEEIVEHSEALMALVLDREDGRSREWPSL